MARCPRSGGEALHIITLRLHRAAQRRQHSRFAGAGVALDALNAIGRAQYIFDHALLSAIQMRVPVGNLDGIGTAHCRLKHVLTLVQPAHDFLFSFDGLRGGELTARHMRAFHRLEFS